METLSHIIASFDIFQVLINASSQMFNPIVDAFEHIFLVLFRYGKNLLFTHPGLMAGLFIFFLGYISITGFQWMRRYFSASLHAPQQRSI